MTRRGLVRVKNYVLGFLATLGLVTMFQNCGGVTNNFEVGLPSSAYDENAPIQEVEEDPTVLSEFFRYPYTSAPEILFEKQVRRVAEAETAEVGDVVVLASMAAASGVVKDMEYTIRIQDPQGRAVCPQASGTLIGGRTTLTARCTSAKWRDRVRVIMDIHVDGQVHQFDRLEE